MLDQAVGRAGGRVRLAQRRIRHRTQVPAVDGPGVPAAPPRPGQGRPLAADGRRDLRGDGPRRDVRPARRRLRALLRGRRPGSCRTSRRCCTTTPSCCASTSTCGAPPARPWPSGSPARRPTSCCGPAHPRGRLRLGAGRRHRGRRGPDLRLDPRAAGRGARARRTAPARPTLLSVTARGTFEHGTSTLQLRADPDDAAWWQRARASGCWPPGRPGRSRPATTRSSRPGTAWPSPRSPKPAPLLGRAPIPRRRAGVRRLPARRPRRRRPAAPVLPRRGGRGRRRRRWTTTATWPRGCWRCTRPPATPAGWVRPRGCSSSRSDHFGDGEGGFYDTADDAEQLFTRPRSQADNAEPSGSSAVAGALLTYAALTGSTRHREAADAALEAAGTPGRPRAALRRVDARRRRGGRRRAAPGRRGR